MKKKILALSLAIAVIAIAVVGGTLAWFVDEDQATNVFTIGEIDIVQNEKNADGTPFTQNQVLLPVVDAANPATDENYVSKVVTVTSEGASDAYVRTFLAVPAVLVGVIHLDADATGAWVKDTAAGQWPNVTVDGIEYAVVSYTHSAALTEGDETVAVLKGVYMDAAVDLQENAGGVKQFCVKDTVTGGYTFFDYDISKNVKILVATQGCQADGFAGGAAAALNDAFGTVPVFTGN